MAELPKDFEDLLPFIAWAEPTEAGRNTRRFSSEYKDLEAFYNAMIARVDAALTYLNGFDLKALNPAQSNLLFMCLSLTEVAFAVENYHQASPPYLFPIARFVPEHDHWKSLYHR